MHSCYYGEGQSDLLGCINEQQPDIILFGGDIVDDKLPNDNAITVFKSLAEKYPCYYVSGNHEYWSGNIDAIKQMISGNAYADTLGQKSIGDIGVEITWYDFGKDYANYILQDDFGVGLYELHISDDSYNQGKTAFVNGKGEVVLQPEKYDGYSSSSSGGETVTVMRKGNQHVYIDSTGIKEIDLKDYSYVGPFIEGYATVTLISNTHNGVIDKNGKLIFEDKDGK